MKKELIVTAAWRGGDRIKIDRIPAVAPNQFIRTAEPPATRFRVFAGDVLGPTGRRSRIENFYSGWHNGPKSEKTIVIYDVNETADIPKIKSTIELLHKKWPELWFYDTTDLGLGHLFQFKNDDNQFDESLGNLL